MGRIILILLFSCCTLFANATHFYVDPSASTSTNVGTLANPWKTLNKVEDAAQTGTTFHPGDTISFKRGQTFTCRDQFNGFRWWAWAGYVCPSGTRTQPIVLNAYGDPSLAAPNFLYPHPASGDSTTRNVLSFEGVHDIVLDSLQSNDTRFAPFNNKIDQAWTLGFVFGEKGGGAETSHCIAKNCYWSNTGMGMIIIGDSNIVEHCYMEKFGNDYAQDNGGGGDFGANPITVTGDSNIIRYNTFKDAWAWSESFGTNGGAIEWFNTNRWAEVYGNLIIDCGGFNELGGTAGSQVMQYIKWYSNIVINCGAMVYSNGTAPFTVQPKNYMFYNNTVIEGDSSRWTGSYWPHGMEDFPNVVPKEAELFGYSGSPTADTVFDIRNNIFILSNTALDLVRSSSIGKTVHLNNLAKFGGTSDWNYTKNASEVKYTGALSNIFVDITDDSAQNWNYHLKSGSPAIDIGAVLSIVTKDFDQVTFSGTREAGALQFDAPTLSSPTVTTSSITSITLTTASGGGNVTDDGGATVTARGVCWSISSNPTVSDSHTTDGSGTGSFTSSITGLSAGTTYHVRAYATNSQGTSYGSDVSFTSLALPTLTTTAISSTTSTTASTGGNISSDGGASVTVRGVCWNTSTNPTTANSTTSNGTGTGSFTSSLTGLSSGVTYYVRAYATNSQGTSYGNEVSFTTLALPTITTTSISSITTTTASSGGNVTSDGGASVTARGVCWSTSSNPTTANSKTANGTGTGSFSSSITGLIANTTYHVRSYATNSVGTSYGSDISFTTSAALGACDGCLITGHKIL